MKNFGFPLTQGREKIYPSSESQEEKERKNRYSPQKNPTFSETQEEVHFSQQEEPHRKESENRKKDDDF